MRAAWLDDTLLIFAMSTALPPGRSLHWPLLRPAWGFLAVLPLVLLPVVLRGARGARSRPSTLLPAASADSLASHPTHLLFRSAASAMERHFLAGLPPRDLESVPQLDPGGPEARRYHVT